MSKPLNAFLKVLPVLGLGLFVFLFVKSGPALIWGNIKGAKIACLLVAVVLLVPPLLLKAYKWGVVLKLLGFAMPFFENAKSIAISYFIGSITPARVGDFSRALYSSKYSIPLTKSFFSVLFDRIFDIGTLLFMGGIGAVTFMFLFSIPKSVILSIVASAIIFLAGTLLIAKKNLAKVLIRPFFYMMVPQKYQAQLISGFNGFYDSVLMLSKNIPSMCYLAILTFACWMSAFVSVYFLALALGIKISIFMLFLILPFTTLVEMLPISISGIGTRDAVLILLFSALAIPSSKAVSLSILILLLNYVLNLLGALLWLKNPFKY